MDAHKNQDEKQTKAMDDEITWEKTKQKEMRKMSLLKIYSILSAYGLK